MITQDFEIMPSHKKQSNSDITLLKIPYHAITQLLGRVIKITKKKFIAKTIVMSSYWSII